MLPVASYNNRPTCSGEQNQSLRFDIYNDEIYALDNSYSAGTIKVYSNTGQCLKFKNDIPYPRYSWYSTKFESIAVNENYIFLGSGKCSWFCSVNQDVSGSITVLRRSNFSYVTRVNTSNRGIRDITSLTLNSDGTKLLVTGKYYSTPRVAQYNISGSNLSFGSYVGNDRYKCYGSSCSNGYHNRPWDAAFDSSGNIFVLDDYGQQIQKFNSSGVYQSKWTWTNNYSGNPFRYPQGMHISSSGIV